MNKIKTVSVTFIAVLMLVSCNKTSTAEYDYSLTPVVLVHGSGLDSRSWSNLVTHLIKNDYPKEYISAVDLVPNNGSNIIAAQTQIKPAVDKLLSTAHRLCVKRKVMSCNTSKVDIVAHSMGAVSSRWYATRVRPDKVRKFISIAGSNHGTNALCRLKGDGNKEMCPAFSMDSARNRVQVLLNSDSVLKYDQTPYGVGYDEDKIRKVPPDLQRKIYYFTLRIEPDEWITPPESAVLQGAGGVDFSDINKKYFHESQEGNYLFLGKETHDNLISNSHVMEFVSTILKVNLVN